MEEELLITLSVSYWLKKDLPVLEVGKLGLSTDTSELYVGTTSGNLKIQDVPEFTAPEPVEVPVPNVTGLIVNDNYYGNQISLIWNSLGGSYLYDVEVDGILYESTGNVFITIYNLTENKPYLITVKTRDVDRVSEGSNISVTTVMSPPVEEPEQPIEEPVENVKNLSVVDNQLGTQISLEWSKVISSEPISYDIEVDEVLYKSTTDNYVKIFDLVKDTTYLITVKTKAGERVSEGTIISVKTVSPFEEEPPMVDPPVEEPVSSVIIKDSFNRPDQVGLGIADSGQAWRQYDTMTPAGTYEIVGNKAVMTNAGAHHSRTYSYIDAEVSDVSVKTTFSPAERASIMVRGKKQENPVEFIRVRGENSGYYELTHYIGGSANSDPSITTVLGTSTIRKNDGDEIEIKAVGENIKVYINGVLDIEANTRALINETLVGFNGGGGDLVYFDSFEVNSIGSNDTPPEEEEPVEPPVENPDGAPVDKKIVGNNEPVYVWVGGVE